MFPARAMLWLAAGILLSGSIGCQPPNHYLIHPNEAPKDVVTWAEDQHRDQLLIHLEWASPARSGPFPTVLVHPEAGKPARAMRGILWDLAARGLLAVAVDYKRLIDGKYRRNIFPWRDDADATAALDIVSRHVSVDRQRIATLGFSQGGVFSLIIAASAPARIKAVAAYYPVTDFEHWLDQKRSARIERFVYRIIRWRFRQQSGAETEEEFRELLRRASPLLRAESIQAPVLLIHGDRDRAADVSESRRLAERLAILGREIRLLIVPGGVHIFNFRQRERAQLAWDVTVAWLAGHLCLRPS